MSPPTYVEAIGQAIIHAEEEIMAAHWRRVTDYAGEATIINVDRILYLQETIRNTHTHTRVVLAEDMDSCYGPTVNGTIDEVASLLGLHVEGLQ